MKSRAAVATKAGAPLEITEVEVAGPSAGEVLVEIKATGVCHTDAFTLSGADPEGLFPAILGHEGAGVVVDVGAGVSTLKKGDHVIPLYTPECRQCEYCTSRQNQSLPGDPRDARPGAHARRLQPLLRRRREADPPLYGHLHLRQSTPWCRRSRWPKSVRTRPSTKICYIGCGVTTGIGAVINTAKVEPGTNCVVFGLGGIGLNVIQGLQALWART